MNRFEAQVKTALDAVKKAKYIGEHDKEDWQRLDTLDYCEERLADLIGHEEP